MTTKPSHSILKDLLSGRYWNVLLEYKVTLSGIYTIICAEYIILSQKCISLPYSQTLDTQQNPLAYFAAASNNINTRRLRIMSNFSDVLILSVE